MGNRGALAKKPGILGKARFRGKRWIICDTEFAGPPLPLMLPRKCTQLFFLDEAVALAAGHRPCFKCRNKAAKCFVAAAWPQKPGVKAAAMDKILHEQRIDPKEKKPLTHTSRFEDLPCGAFVKRYGEAWLVLHSSLVRYTPSGYDYDRRIERPTGHATVLTPPVAVDALAGGYSPILHSTACPETKCERPERR